MKAVHVAGKDIIESQLDDFTDVIRNAFEKPQLDASDHFDPENVYFYITHDEKTVAFGRYLKVSGITIDNKLWAAPVYGRSLVAVLKQHRAKGYGQLLVNEMRSYALEREWSQIGIHGKNALVASSSKRTLSEFYAECGLSIDESIGRKLFAPRNGLLHDLSHTNISYMDGDPFIEAARTCTDGVILPFSW